MHQEVMHPCIQHKLALIRDRETGHQQFRELVTEITMLCSSSALARKLFGGHIKSEKSVRRQVIIDDLITAWTQGAFNFDTMAALQEAVETKLREAELNDDSTRMVSIRFHASGTCCELDCGGHLKHTC